MGRSFIDEEKTNGRKLNFIKERRSERLQNFVRINTERKQVQSFLSEEGVDKNDLTDQTIKKKV